MPHDGRWRQPSTISPRIATERLGRASKSGALPHFHTHRHLAGRWTLYVFAERPTGEDFGTRRFGPLARTLITGPISTEAPATLCGSTTSRERGARSGFFRNQVVPMPENFADEQAIVDWCRQYGFDVEWI